MTKILLVGLGNSGMEGTRHNLGIEVVKDFFGEATWYEDRQAKAELASMSEGATQIVGFFPLTFMNDSGKAIKEWLHQTPIEVGNILIVHDELELPLGQVRLDEQGGPARGHNGVRSVIAELSTDAAPRLRIGIGRPEHPEFPIDQFVLGKFTDSEREQLAPAAAQAKQLIQDFIERRRNPQ